MNVFLIPVARRAQRFQIALSDKRYTIQIRWNRPNQAWVMDISDEKSEVVANGIMVVSGADLLNQLNYLGFGGAIIAQSTLDVMAIPTYEGLGTTDWLYYIPYGQDGETPYLREFDGTN